MTQEQKQLLLKDLSARLPYGVIYHRNDGANIELREVDIKNGTLNYTDNIVVRECKPYLRPMSSMTEEEQQEYYDLTHQEGDDVWAKCLFDKMADFCNERHLDYRGLIPGLALEAPEGMYDKDKSERGSEIPVPKTIDEAVKTLARIVSKEDRDYLLENGAISMHHSLGRWIRNEWGLWAGSELKNELKRKGFEHPDDMSNYIIEEFVKYWNNKI